MRARVSAKGLMYCIYSVIDLDPLCNRSRRPEMFMMRPREGVPYVLCRDCQASAEVAAVAMKGTIEGEREPMMALRSSWSWRIQRV